MLGPAPRPAGPDREECRAGRGRFPGVAAGRLPPPERGILTRYGTESGPSRAPPDETNRDSTRDLQRDVDRRTVDLFRRWGYLAGGRSIRSAACRRSPSRARRPRDPAGRTCREIYCGTIGVEFMHIPTPSAGAGSQERMEAAAPARRPARASSSSSLRAESSSSCSRRATSAPSASRSRGVAALIPLLDADPREPAAEHGARQVVIGMSHRGRLNVMVHTVRRKAAGDLRRVRGRRPAQRPGRRRRQVPPRRDRRLTAPRTAATFSIHLVSNPSHLEAVDPVVVGRVRAKQARLGDDERAAGAADPDPRRRRLRRPGHRSPRP